jgi:hypothetical protein
MRGKIENPARAQKSALIVGENLKTRPARKYSAVSMSNVPRSFSEKEKT